MIAQGDVKSKGLHMGHYVLLTIPAAANFRISTGCRASLRSAIRTYLR